MSIKPFPVPAVEGRGGAERGNLPALAPKAKADKFEFVLKEGGTNMPMAGYEVPIDRRTTKY